jgi:hypothetical protein
VSDPFKITEEIGFNSARVNFPDRTATVSSPIRQIASVTESLYTHTFFENILGRVYEEELIVIHDAIVV